MSDVLRVELPAELADELIDEGFEESLSIRSLLADAETVIAVTSAGLTIGASVATIVVARRDLREFVAVVGDWIHRKAAGRSEQEMTIDFSARNGDEERRVRVKVESTNGISEADAAALTAFMTSLLSGDATEDATPKSG